MKRFGFILLMLTALVLSCTREPSPGPDSSEVGFKTIHYKVQVSSFDDSKATTADNDTKYVFQATDSLYVTSTVTDPESGDPLLFGVLKLISGSGATTAYFEGDLVDVNEFEPAPDTPINVTLVSSGDRIHKTARGKLTGTAYPSNEYGTSLADAVQKFSHFTCSTTFGNTRFTLTQQSAFLVFTVSFKRTEVAVSTPITAKIFNNSEATPVWQNVINAAALGGGRSRVDFVVAFPGGSTSLTDAELSVVWGNGENDHKEFAIADKDLAINSYYTVPRTTIDLGNPFHIRAKEDGTTIRFKTTFATGSGDIQYLSYDLGVDDWTPYDGSSLSLSKDYVVYFKGTRANCDCVGATQLFTANHVCYIGGNITSLLADPTQFADYAFRSAFSNGTCVDAVTTPAEVNWVDIDSAADPLILPSFTSAECYREMFRNCSSLTTVPDLPATSVSPRCYWNMFRLCNGLTTASGVLPAETLAEDCYREMFRQCANLKSVPMLPAPTLAERCYRQMFAACTSLLSVTCLATDISAPYCTYQWMSGTKNSNNCYFYKASTMGVSVSGGWTRGIDGILSNWQVEDYVEPTP